MHPSLDPAADGRATTRFRLPFDGLWHVSWGGPAELHNYHVSVPSQRYAYDFTIWQNGSTCLCYGDV